MEKLHFITPFPMTIGNLPASYDESLSYLQKLMLLQKKLNETITNLNEVITIVENIDANFDEINSQIESLQTQIININSRISQEFQRMYNQVLGLLQEYKLIFDNNLLSLKNELEEEIERIELGDVKAYNPTNGTFENVSKVIMDVYSILRNNAITCTEFDALELTATAYDALDISAYNFDVDGKEFLDVA